MSARLERAKAQPTESVEWVVLWRKECGEEAMRLAKPVKSAAGKSVTLVGSERQQVKVNKDSGTAARIEEG